LCSTQEETTPHLSALSTQPKATSSPPPVCSCSPIIPFTSASHWHFFSRPLPRIKLMHCPSDNTQAVDQSHFWSSGSVNWDAHRVGWAVAGTCALLVRAIFFRKDDMGSSSSGTDCYILCYNRSTSLSVCHGLIFNAHAS